MTRPGFYHSKEPDWHRQQMTHAMRQKFLKRVYDHALERKSTSTKWKHIAYACMYGAYWRDIISWRFQ